MIDVPWQLLGTPVGEVVIVALGGLGVYLAVIVATRIVGLRSLATMSAFDFAMTVAIGSIVASVAVTSAPLVNGVGALVVLYGAQWSVSRLRRRTSLERVIDNRPLLLVRDGEVIEAHLAAARVTRDDIRAKLRAQNVTSWAQVHAVVLETTGDVSVLQGGSPPEPDLLDGVVTDLAAY